MANHHVVFIEHGRSKLKVPFVDSQPIHLLLDEFEVGHTKELLNKLPEKEYPSKFYKLIVAGACRISMRTH